MKYLFFFIAIFLVSCKSRIKPESKEEISLYDKYNKLRLEASHKNSTTDTTVLQFVFGMSKEQFENKCNELKNEGVLFVDPEDQSFIYKIKDPSYDEPLDCGIAPSFDSLGLYRVGLIAKIKPTGSLYFS